VAQVLIVDDEPDLRRMLRLICENAGYHVTEATNGAAALERVALSQPDLIVTDLMMPVMNGNKLIQRLRQDPKTAVIPVLEVTGNPDAAEGADATLSKPLEPHRLLDTMASLLKGEEET
jgi:CheY-like chemotaxis protein